MSGFCARREMAAARQEQETAAVRRVPRRKTGVDRAKKCKQSSASSATSFQRPRAVRHGVGRSASHGGYRRRRLMAEGLASSAVPREPPGWRLHVACSHRGATVPKLSLGRQKHNKFGLAKLSQARLDFGTQR